MKKLSVLGCLIFVVVMSGCTAVQVLTPIGARGYEWGHVPTGNFDPSPGSLAAFGSRILDGNGIIYTTKAGAIDPDHIWGCGRKTFAAYKSAYDALINGKPSFSSNAINIIINYPHNWNMMPQSEKVKLAQEVAMELAQSIGFHCEIYHELNTWWGGGIDYESSFSWEDLYSNALGATLSMKAKKMELNGQGSAKGNFTKLTQRFVNENNYVSSGRCAQVVSSLENIYWRERPIQKILICRNVDIGADGWIDNTPIPGFTFAKMTRIKAPMMDFSNFKGFNIQVFVGNASYAREAKQVLGLDRAIQLTDHPRLMQIVKKQILAKGHKVFD